MMTDVTVGARLRHASVSVRREVVLAYLRLTERNRHPDVRMVAGLPFLALPSVFPPDSFTTGLLVRNRLRLAGREVLEVGCGAGAFAVLAGQLATRVVAADVSADAVLNTQLNVRWHGATNVQVLQSDLFEHVTGTFDTIVFNAPFFPGKASRPGEHMWLSDDGSILKRFLAAAPQHLRSGGELWLTHSTVADEPALFDLLRRGHWTWSVMDARDIYIEAFRLYRVTRSEATD